MSESQYTDFRTQLILNKLTHEQYQKLKLSELVDENQLYMVTDDIPVSDLISSALSNHYTKNETSSAVQINTAFENINIKPLEGKTYDFSTNTGRLSAITDLVDAFGGTVLNNPINT